MLAFTEWLTFASFTRLNPITVLDTLVACLALVKHHPRNRCIIIQLTPPPIAKDSRRIMRSMKNDDGDDDVFPPPPLWCKTFLHRKCINQYFVPSVLPNCSIINALYSLKQEYTWRGQCVVYDTGTVFVRWKKVIRIWLGPVKGKFRSPINRPISNRWQKYSHSNHFQHMPKTAVAIKSHISYPSCTTFSKFHKWVTVLHLEVDNPSSRK